MFITRIVHAIIGSPPDIDISLTEKDVTEQLPAYRNTESFAPTEKYFFVGEKTEYGYVINGHKIGKN